MSDQIGVFLQWISEFDTTTLCNAKTNIRSFIFWNFKMSTFEFECFKCLKQFNSEKLMIQHLKLDHFIRDESTQLRCVVKANKCENVITTFGGLSKHINKK